MVIYLLPSSNYSIVILSALLAAHTGIAANIIIAETINVNIFFIFFSSCNLVYNGIFLSNYGVLTVNMSLV